MKNNINKISLILLFISISLFFAFPLKIKAVDIDSDYYNYHSNSDYNLNSYDINIIVNENNTLNITEKIGAYFNVEKHGIFRKIPLRNEVTRLDGTTSKNRAKISDIKVSDNYSLSTESGYSISSNTSE